MHADKNDLLHKVLKQWVSYMTIITFYIYKLLTFSLPWLTQLKTNLICTRKSKQQKTVILLSTILH